MKIKAISAIIAVAIIGTAILDGCNTMNETHNYHREIGRVVNLTSDEILVELDNHNTYKFIGNAEDFEISENLEVIVDTKNTQTPYDDEIVAVNK